MAPIDEPTLGEVFRSQQRVERKIDGMTSEVTGLSKATQKAEADLQALTARVEEHDQFKRWAIQLVLGFIILSVLGAVFVIGTGGAS